MSSKSTQFARGVAPKPVSIACPSMQCDGTLYTLAAGEMFIRSPQPGLKVVDRHGTCDTCGREMDLRVSVRDR